MSGHDQTVQILKREFSKFMEADDNHSQGDFARLVGMHPSTLSSLFAGRRKLSQDLAAIALDRLKASQTEKDAVIAAFETDRLNQPSTFPKGWRCAEREYTDVGQSHFNPRIESARKHYCSDLKVMTLLHLITCEGYKKEGRNWLLRKLKCSVDELNQCLQTLLDLGVVMKVKDRYFRKAKPVLSKRGSRKQEHKKYASQVIEAIAKANELPQEERFFYNWVAAIDPKDIPKISKEIERVILRYNRMIRVSEPKEVFTFFTALAPLTDVDPENKINQPDDDFTFANNREASH